MKTTLAKFTIGLFLISYVSHCLAQPNFSVKNSLFNVPTAYKDAMSKLMLSEVNDYARQLNLPEYLPITTNSVVAMFVTPPRFGGRLGTLGSIRTENVSYDFGKGSHLCYITRNIKGSNPYDPNENRKYSIDPASVNTNAAYMLATQYLANAFVNVPLLSTSSVVSIQPLKILNMTTSKYRVEWQRGGKPVAKVVVASPQNELWTLRVEDPSLILRKPLEVAGFPLETNVSTGTIPPNRLIH